MSDLEFYERGYNAETLIAEHFRREGYFVIITADVKERGRRGAPGARGQDEFITLPDLDVGKFGHRGFVEVKYKTEPTYTIKTGRYEHGIGLKKWNMYRKAQFQFGTTVYLCIYEGNSGAVLLATINEIVPLQRIYTGDKMDDGGMIFFPRASFGLWGMVRAVTGQLPLDIPVNGTDGDFFKVVRSKEMVDKEEQEKHKRQVKVTQYAF